MEARKTTKVRGLDKNPRQPYWKTKEGNEIPLDRLDDEHLLNILGFLRKKAKYIYKIQRQRSKEWTHILPNIYDDLQVEAYRRKLISWSEVIESDQFHFNNPLKPIETISKEYSI